MGLAMAPKSLRKRLPQCKTVFRPRRDIFLSMSQSFARRVLLLMAMFVISASAKTKYQPLPVHLDHDGEKWAEKTLHKMSVEEKVGQLFMIWTRAEFLNA